MDRKLLDGACEVAFVAIRNKGKIREKETYSTQISQLVEIVDSQSIDEVFEELLVHILYQTARGSIDEFTTKTLIKYIDVIRSTEESLEVRYRSLREFIVSLKRLYTVFEKYSTLADNAQNKIFNSLVTNFAKM